MKQFNDPKDLEEEDDWGFEEDLDWDDDWDDELEENPDTGKSSSSSWNS